MSVMYTPRGDGNRRSNTYSSGTQNTTQDLRNLTGFLATVGIFVSAYYFFQLVSLLLVGMGTVGIVLVVALSFVCMVATVSWVFTALEQARVAVLLLPMGVFALSFFIPGLPALLAAAFVVLTCVVALYLLAVALLRSRLLAVAIASLPLLGAAFVVPYSLSSSGLVVHANEERARSVVSPRLRNVQELLSKEFHKSAVVSYQIRENRLYADIVLNGTVQSIQLDTSDLIRTPVRWLEYDLSRRLAVILAPEAKGPDPSMAKILSPISTHLRGCDAVLVAGGALANFPHQSVLEAKDVFRASSLDAGLIEKNLSQWTSSQVISPEQVALVNALPQSREELEALGLANEPWEKWARLHGEFMRKVPESMTSAGSATRASMLRALQDKRCALFVFAHCDGVSIRLPNGESLTVNDFREVADAIRANRPQVFLFSCETARSSNVKSFAKALLDYGAQAVVAPVTLVSATEALRVFSSFLKHALGPDPSPVNQAFRKALEETRRNLMEVWLATVQSGRRIELVLGRRCGVTLTSNWDGTTATGSLAGQRGGETMAREMQHDHGASRG
jgi:hypothetical protein